MGQGHNFFPWIHEDDLANMILHAATIEPRVPVMNGVAPTTTTQTEFCREMKRVLGRPQWFPPMGIPVHGQVDVRWSGSCELLSERYGRET